MKLRTSYFNGGVFRKNLTRFAPAWGLYLVFGVLITVMGGSDRTADWFAREIGYAMSSMSTVNMVYGLIVALLLFGDLFSSRMCNALHAMPLRREGWFLTNAVSGLVFSLLPNAVITLVMLLFTGLYGHMALGWLLLMCLQYLFFFGLAVFSVFCAGNRFAAALVYGIVNYIAMLAFFLMETLFVPLLYGIQLYDEAFNPFCPAVHMLSLDYVESIWVYAEETASFPPVESMQLNLLWNDFLYALLCAGIGIALMAAALLLYRKRNLETAGDFIAVKVLRPVFLVLYTLCVGAVVYLFFEEFLGSDGLVFLFIGLAIGYFTGKMFLNRTTRVFGGKSWLGYAALAGAVGLSLLLTVLDPLGITRWVPELERVKSVAFSEETYALYNDGGYHKYTAEGQQEIADLLTLHRYAVENPSDEYSRDTCNVCLKYTLKNGRQVYREYTVPVDSSAGQTLREYTNTAEYILCGYFDSFAQALPHLIDVHGDAHIPPEHHAELLSALEQDMQEGNLSPVWELYPDEETVTWLTLCIQLPESSATMYAEIVVRTNAEHTVTFLRDNDYLEKYEEKFGEEIFYD